MRGKHLVKIAAGWLLVLCSLSAAVAEVKLPAVLGDNMVLQQGRPVPIWGWAEPGEMVAVTVPGQSVISKADKDGQWQVKLAKLDEDKPIEINVTGSSGSKVTLKNILVGEVWVCSGQSNMQWPVSRADHAQQEIAAATYPAIRLFSVTRKTADKPRDDCTGAWSECSPQSVADFSAVGYYFGRHLHEELKVPIGLINTSWGGTPAETWAARQALEAEPSLKPLLDRWDQQVAGFDPDAASADYKRRLESWQQAAAKAKQEGKQPPPKPQPPADPGLSPHRPANLYNGMIAPLVPFALRGAIWYQGESNVPRAYQYRTLFPLMIRNWRAAWGQGEFPFGFVQLAPFNYHERWKSWNPEITPAWCAELWEAQSLTLNNVPHTGMAVTVDIGNTEDIHPTNKQEVGRRLGLWALAKVYQRALVYSGPIYKSMQIEGDKIRLQFDHTGGGLSTRDGKPPSHFTIAGPDKQFHPATAEIDGQTILVHSDQVSKPIAVRFAWHDTAEPNLSNKEALPASPFRTDQFPCQTEARH